MPAVLARGPAASESRQTGRRREPILDDVELDRDVCLRAIEAKDSRFDGLFFVAVRTTGIYCRPSCPAQIPRPENMEFVAAAAAAQALGYRACKRCRPDAVPGSPEWDHRADLTARAMRLVADGVVDRDGVPGLARRLGYSVRQLERHLTAELGAGPLALARARRAQTARVLIENTDLPMAEIAFAAGFSSVRSFNETVREVFAVPPSGLRRIAGSAGPGAAGTGPARQAPGAVTVALRLPFRPPLLPDNLFGHLAATAVPGVEEWRDGAYRCALRLAYGTAVAALSPRPEHVDCRLTLTDLRDLAAAVARCRWMLDLDADPVAVDDCLRADGVLEPLVAKDPGRRVPRTADPAGFAIRAVLGQQVSTAAARTHAARLVRACGDPVQDPDGGLTHVFPGPAALAGVDPESLALPRARRAAVLRLAEDLAAGELDLGPGCDRAAVRARLAGLPGIGPWTVETIAMRALGDPDAFPPTDLGVRQAARHLGLPSAPGALTARARPWRPWRAYAVQHLWATGGHAVNRLPAP